MHKTSFFSKVLVNSTLLHQWLHSLFSDFDSTYFKSENNAFLVKRKFANSYISEFSILEIRKLSKVSTLNMEHMYVKEEKRYTAFGDRLHHMQHSWHRYIVIMIQTISTNLTVKSVHNSTCALPSEYLLVMTNFR